MGKDNPVRDNPVLDDLILDLANSQTNFDTRVRARKICKKITGDFSQAALVVIDVQREFCDPELSRGTGDTHRIAGRIADAAEQFREAGIAVYSIHYDSQRRGHAFDVDYHLFAPEVGDIVIAKDADSAFRGSDLKKKLNANGHKYLFVCGFNLSSCVRKTVEDARGNGFVASLLKPLCGNDEWNSRLGFLGNSVDVEYNRFDRSFTPVFDYSKILNFFNHLNPLPIPNRLNTILGDVETTCENIMQFQDHIPHM